MISKRGVGAKSKSNLVVVKINRTLFELKHSGRQWKEHPKEILFCNILNNISINTFNICDILEILPLFKFFLCFSQSKFDQ